MGNRSDRVKLLSLIVEKSFMYTDEPSFKLASGKISSYYVNCKKTTYHPQGIDLIGKLIAEMAEQYSPDGIGGLTLGADPIAVAASGESYRRGKPVRAFVVRKQVKEHGTKLPIEGEMTKGETVVIIEDVITTGGSAIIAINAVKEFGLKPVAVISLVDRQEGGRENIEAEGLEVKALFTKDEIMEAYRTANGADTTS